MGQAPREVMFRLVKIDGPVHDPAKHTYWHGPFAECSSTLDINGDGKPDIAAGRNYYIAPYWQKFADYRDGAETNGPDVDDNFEGTMDVDGDGLTDVISSGWMRRQGIWWYRNPGKVGVKWESFPIHQADGLEGMVIGNIAGRGDKDLLVNYFAKKAGRGLVWMEHINQAPWFKEHRIGPDNVGVSHGSGLGDMNGDGRLDAVTTTGWFEAPPDPAAGKWTWHPDWDFGGGAGLPILITDVNADGRNDLILGSDHGYGLAWYEQKMDGGKRTFVKHMIETDFPTFHTMALADLTGDGKPELITGKQLLAHNGGDVGALEPSFVFYYDIDGGKFRRHILSWTNLEPLFREAGHAPPPTNVIGVGMRLSVEDLDQNGKLDVVVACRSGLYVFFNQGYSKKARGINPLPDRNMYPDHRGWYTERAPAKDADGFVTLFDGKSLAGWQPTTNWVVEDGGLALKDRTDRREHNDNYLWTPRSYGDFELELEFKVAEGTNSGIFVRTASPLDPVQTGIEVQIAAPRAGSAPSKNSVGGLYDMVAASSPDVRVGEWNKCRVTARGAKLSVEMNGKLVSEANLDQWTTPRRNPDGTPNKFVMALKDYPRVGFIGLQDHGTPVWYRNIRIREIGK
jgi:hypothetical protein